MSRKPINEQQPTECRQAIWDWIREHQGAFGIADIDVRLDPSSIRDYVIGLRRAGYLEEQPGPKFSPSTYRLINDTGVDAPRVRRDGTPVTQGQGRRQMWNAMQVLKEFSPADLAFNASTEVHTVAETEARTYCQILCAAGYLMHQSGSAKNAAHRYRLIPTMWTGPHPPQIQRTKQVYDPNLKRVVWSRVEGGAE